MSFPQASTAVQVRSMRYPSEPGRFIVISMKSNSGAGSQLSVAVALPVLVGSVLDVHNTVISGGQVMAGGCVSSIVISCTHVLVLPHVSVAVHVRVMEYSCGHDGEVVVTSAYVRFGDRSQLSLAVGSPVLSGKVESVHSMVTFGAQVIAGITVSSIVIV